MSNEDTMKKTFTTNLNRLLQERGITQAELAAYMEVSNTTVNNWVKGYKVPRMDKVDKLCSFFKIKRSELLEQSPAPFAAQVQNSPPPSAQTCTPEEADLIQKYKQLDEAERELVDTMIDKLHEQRSGKFDASSHETTAS